MASKTRPAKAARRPPAKRRRRPLSRGRNKGNALSALRTALDILREVQQGADATRESVAESLGISTKQVARYLAVLHEAGVDFALDENGDPAHHLRLESAIRVSDVPFNAFNLTRDELLLLYAYLSGICHAGDGAHRRRLWDKVRRHLSAAKVNAGQIASALGGFQKAYKSYDTPERRAVISALLQALYLNRACNVTYRAPNTGEAKRYPVEPYEMVEFDGGLYLYCHQPYYKNVLLLAVERIAELEVTDDEFPRRREIEEEIGRKQARAFRILDDSKPLDVALRFKPGAAFYVEERIWHPTETKQRHPDGSLTLRFRATGRIEIERWIRSWGEECGVVGMEEANAGTKAQP